MATSNRVKQLEAIFVPTPPPSPQHNNFSNLNSVTRTTTPRDLPTMYHFDFGITDSETIECGDGDGEDVDVPSSPRPLTTGQTIPVPEEAYSSKPAELTPCPCCSRTFNLNALRKHIVICEKSAAKKRKVFDSSRQRREGTSLSTYVLPKNFGLPNAERAAGVHTPPGSSRESAQQPVAEAAATPQPTRRNSKGELARGTTRGSMRKNSNAEGGGGGGGGAGGGGGSAAPLAAAAAAPERASRVRSSIKRIKDTASDRCPHCDRTFNPKAFDRHVEWCKEKSVQAAIKSANSAETSKAKERMEARKQYRPPNLKTKRSINRDKYSSNHEDLLEAGDMMAPKQSLMSLSSMTSSVHSENPQIKAANQTPSQKLPISGGRQGRRGSVTMVTENTVSLKMAHDEEPPSPPPPQRAATMQRVKRRQHANDTCDQIDDTMMRIRRAASREALQLARLDKDNIEIAPRLPKGGKLRKAHSTHEKLELAETIAAQSPVTMRFEDLNGLIKGGTPICDIEMDEADLKISSKSRSSTSLVRQARRRIRTREHPSIEMRASGSSSDLLAVARTKKTDSLHITTTDQIDCSLVPMHRVPRSMYSGSEDEGAEIQIKLETSTTRTLCRPKKRGNQLPQAIGCSEPMRALPMPQLKQNFEALGQNISQTPLPRLELGSDRMENDELEIDSMSDGVEDEVPSISSSKSKRAAKTRSIKSRTPEELSVDDEEEEEEVVAPVKLPPLVKQGSNISRRLVVLEQDENGTMYIKDPPSPHESQSRTRPSSGRSRVKSGDKYDPFLSAKRQLEELCSPSTPPPNEDKIVASTTPITAPNIAMTSSLTGSTSKPLAASTPKAAPISNFRRTSSLRGPRRTPLLPSRPLFATNYRPTIQRGLSDEGPISSNFLKPEEFDEMPVRAACGNDFHSPRVVRRDTSASNRKQQLKLPMPSANTNVAGPESPAPGRSVAKTDSLAVFLKYEHDLEQQLNAKAAEMTSKELKDKSNNLSKQNSAKSLVQPGQLPSLSPSTTITAPSTPISSTKSVPVKENNENVLCSFPLISKPNPITAPPAVIAITNSSSINTPIKLENIFIDPKLINACDNLHLGNRATTDTNPTPQHLGQSRSRSSSQSTITHERRHSGEARNQLKRKMRLGRNQFLYDASPEEAYASSGCCSADDEANRSSMEYDEQCWQQQQKQLLANPLPLPSVMPNIGHNLMPSFDNFDFEEFLSSFENENDEEQFPLFRDCREFLLNRTKRSAPKASYTATAQTTTTTTTTTATPTALTNNNITKSHSAHRCDSSDEKLLRQQSNVSSISSHDEKQKENNKEKEREKRLTDQQKREIFISIETETNAQGRSPISPESLRHMVGNPQTKIDVLHIENGNEPEHAKFSKISDTEDADGEVRFDDKVKHQQQQQQQQAQLTSSSNLLGANGNPNVQLNNAKNLIQQMQSDFRQLGEDASASMRRAMTKTEESSTKEKPKMDGKTNAGGSSHSGDSDEFSSLDGYPMSSSQSSRRGGASSKLSSDSAYGSSNSPYSLSRQRSSELSTNSPRTGAMLRPHTASAKLMDASTQAQTAYGTLKARQRLFAAGVGGDANPDGAESSSSGSENSLTKINNNNSNKQQQQQQQQQSQMSNYNYQQQQQQQQQQQCQSNNNNLLPTPTTSQQSLLSSSSSMSSSMKMSKFCHECGGKFVIEHAKFCMECGVRRVVL